MTRAARRASPRGARLPFLGLLPAMAAQPFGVRHRPLADRRTVASVAGSPNSRSPPIRRPAGSRRYSPLPARAWPPDGRRRPPRCVDEATGPPRHGAARATGALGQRRADGFVGGGLMAIRIKAEATKSCQGSWIRSRPTPDGWWRAPRV